MRLEEFLDHLQGVKWSGGQALARCPAHEDQVQSLSVTQNGDGIAVYCHAGCETEEILTSLDLEYDDLFYEEIALAPPTPQIIATYDYTNEAGEFLYQVVRYEPKAFKQRRKKQGEWVWNMQGVERVPYLLHEWVNNEDPIFIVEGEKDVHTLRAHGYQATTNPGGAGKWSRKWHRYFLKRDVFVVPDVDPVGMGHGEDIAQMLSEVSNVKFLKLWDAKDITDWFQEHDELDFADLIATSAQSWEQVLDEKREEAVNQFPEPPIQTGLLGEIVDFIAPHSEADPIALFMELLTLFGNCVGGGPFYKIGGTYHRANLFIVICGDTAIARKGTAHDWAVEIFRNADPAYIQSGIVGGLASGEGIVHSVRDAKTRLDTKTDKVVVMDEGVTDKRRLFFESEFAGRTLTAMNREGNTLSSVIRQAWETSNLAVVTKQNDERATNAHIAIVGHATVRELLSKLRQSDVAGGFANRFLFFIVRRSKVLPIQSEPDSRTLTHFSNCIRARLAQARQAGQIRLAPTAEELWIKIYHEIDQDTLTREDVMVPYLSRGHAQVLRLALLLALVEGKKSIETEQLEQANELWRYACRSIEYMLTGETLASELTNDELALFEYLNGAVRAQQVSEVQKALKWNGTRLALARSKLIRKKLIVEKTEKTGGRGRPRKMMLPI